MLGDHVWRGPSRRTCAAIFAVAGITASLVNVGTAALLVWASVYFPTAVRELVGLLLFGLPGSVMFLSGWRTAHLIDVECTSATPQPTEAPPHH